MTSKPFDYEVIRQLALILDETDLTEIEVELEKLKIRVARQPAAAVNYAPPPGNWAPPAPVAAAPAAVAAPAAKPADPASHPGALKSPMVGTCYLAPEPGAANYINVGDSVREGQTLLIVEAMKHMNPIVAPRAGKISAIFVENGQPVEYGEPMLVIE